MKRSILPSRVAIFLCFSASATVRAQMPAPAPSSAPSSMPDKMSGMQASPNILMIQTDNIKPYATTPYDKVAAQYITVAAKAKLPGLVIAMEALSGANRAQYLFSYNSFDDMQQQNDAVMKNASLSAGFANLDSLE